MRKKRYRRKCGDFEVRVLADGRVIMLAPDEQLLQVAGTLDPHNKLLAPPKRNSEKSRLLRCARNDIETESKRDAGK